MLGKSSCLCRILLCLLLLLQGSHLGIHLITLDISVHILYVSLVNHGVGGILHPYIGAEGAFAGALQGRTIYAVGASVVLPCDIILSYLIESAGGINLLLVRLADAHVVSGRAVRTHAGIYEQKAVVGNLRANLLSSLVLHDIGLALLWDGIAQLRLHLAHAERDEFRAGGGSWIAYHDGGLLHGCGLLFRSLSGSGLLCMAVVRTCQCQEYHQASGRDALHHFSVNLFHFDLFVFYLIRMNSC